MVESKSNRCNRCGAPKTTDAKGSLTQWISVCRCDLIVSNQSNQGQTLKLCQTCGKRINPGRAGSLTQWILRGDLCSCATPVPKVVVDDGTLGASASQNWPAGGGIPSNFDAPGSGVEVGHDEPELEVDADSFPLERYKPIELLGSGGSGLVYRCMDRLLNNRVAVKVLLTVSKEQVINFQREAKAGSSLQHPHLVSVRDFGVTASGAPYMVMDFVPGMSLDKYLEDEGGLTEAEAVQVFSQVADALAYAHDKKVFHRDLKTSNIIISLKRDEAQAYVIDFGVADISQDTTIPGSSALVGTPAYMSPDVAKGKNFDARSEIYSLGCVMFESLAGSVPFIGDTALNTIHMHASMTPPKLSDMTDGRVSEKLEHIVMKCLEKEPEKRFQSMAEVKEMLLSSALPSPKFKMPADASEFERQPVRDKKVLIVSLSIVFLIVASVCGFNYAVNFLASKSEKAAAIPSWESSTGLDKVVADGIDLSLHQDDGIVEWKEPGHVKVHGGSDEQLATALQLNKNSPIRWLTISEGKFSRAALQSLSKLNLSALTISGVDLTDTDLIVLPKLTAVSMSHCKFRDDDPFKLFSSSPHMVQITLYSCDMSNNSFSSLSGLKKLDRLTLSDCGGFTDGLQHPRSLHDLDWNAIRTAQYPEPAFTQAVSLPDLRTLTLDGNKLSYKQYQELSKPNLAYLQLSGNTTLPIENLETLRNLRGSDVHLSFRYKCLDRDSIPALMGRQWKLLSFWDTKMEDDFLRRLAKVDCNAYIFDEPNISMDGLIRLLRARPVKFIYLSSKCPIFSGEEIFKLQSSRPNCVIRCHTQQNELVEVVDGGRGVKKINLDPLRLDGLSATPD